MTIVNRYLKDKAMDMIDHALGRPTNPLEESYRNRFILNGDETILDNNPHWIKIPSVFDEDIQFFKVTDEGRQALVDYLKEINDPHREYIVSVEGVDMKPIAAKSHGNARYQAYNMYADAFEGTTFKDFQKVSRVRLKK